MMYVIVHCVVVVTWRVVCVVLAGQPEHVRGDDAVPWRRVYWRCACDGVVVL